MAAKNEQLDIDYRYSLNGEQVKFFRTRKVMTIIYMDKDMLLKEPSNENQTIDRQAFCPGVIVGEVIKSPLNPILYSD